MTKNHKIGVDVEYTGTHIDREDLAERFFGEVEYQQFMERPEALRPVFFYQLWTCKEAYIKALGKGLSYPLNEFNIIFQNDIKESVIVDDQKERSQSWSVHSFSLETDYMVALAVQEKTIRIRHMKAT